MTYFCANCRETFDEPAYFDPGTGEQFSCCPMCESEYIDEAHHCERCGEYAGAESMIDGMCPECDSDRKVCTICGERFFPHELTHGLCGDCRADAWKKYTDFLDGLEDDERAALLESIEAAARCA